MMPPPRQLSDVLSGKTFPPILRFLWRRIPDGMFSYAFAFSWRLFLDAYRISPSPYSLTVVSIASLGWIAVYASLRYGTVLSRRVHWTWKLYWTLLIGALAAELVVRRELSAAVLNDRLLTLGYCLLILCLVATGVVAVANMIRTRTTVLRLAALLLVQALLVFAFAQPLVYCRYVDTRWDTEASLERAAGIVNAGREATVAALLSPTPELLHSVVKHLRHPTPMPEWLILEIRDPLRSPTVLVAGDCERVNYGPALYLSTITWTSVGFGDLVPTPEARSLLAIESILGYLFMAALAAVLLGWMRQSGDRSSKEAP